MGRNSVCLSVCLTALPQLAFRPCLVTLRPLQLALRPHQREGPAGGVQGLVGGVWGPPSRFWGPARGSGGRTRDKQTNGQTDKQNFSPFYRTLSGTLLCYPLRLHHIKDDRERVLLTSWCLLTSCFLTICWTIRISTSLGWNSIEVYFLKFAYKRRIDFWALCKTGSSRVKAKYVYGIK